MATTDINDDLAPQKANSDYLPKPHESDGFLEEAKEPLDN